MEGRGKTGNGNLVNLARLRSRADAVILKTFLGALSQTLVDSEEELEKGARGMTNEMSRSRCGLVDYSLSSCSSGWLRKMFLLQGTEF